MNKILMDGDRLIIDDSISNITVDGIATLIINNTDDIILNIDMNDSSNLTILDFNTNSKKRDITVNQNNNATLNYIHTFFNDNEYNFKYIANIKGNNNINNINITGVNNNKTSIYVDGIVNKKIKNNELNENIRILNLEGKVDIMPMLHISILDVIANHNTAISNISKNELFYLNSKGIDDDTARNLIKDSYLYGLFNEYPEFESLIRGGDVIE